jgi:hypothetical protein
MLPTICNHLFNPPLHGSAPGTPKLYPHMRTNKFSQVPVLLLVPGNPNVEGPYWSEYRRLGSQSKQLLMVTMN